jgi:hypothetical protein
MSIPTILLDGNIYDRLFADQYTCTKLTLLIAKGSVRVIATPTVVAELTKSPFLGVPKWFPVDLEPEAATDQADTEIADAVIAASAHALADLMVSEDHGCRWRLSQLSTRCKALSYAEFRSWLTNAPDQ